MRKPKIETCRHALEHDGAILCWQTFGRKDIPGWMPTKGGILIHSHDCRKCPTYEPKEKADE